MTASTAADNDAQIPKKLVDKELLAYGIHGVADVLSQLIHQLEVKCTLDLQGELCMALDILSGILVHRIATEPEEPQTQPPETAAPSPEKILELRASGLTDNDIARMFGVHTKMVTATLERTSKLTH
jgi:hypothetical protein